MKQTEVTQSDRSRPEPLLVAAPSSLGHQPSTTATSRPPQPSAGPCFRLLSPRTSGARRSFVLTNTAGCASLY